MGTVDILAFCKKYAVLTWVLIAACIITSNCMDRVVGLPDDFVSPITDENDQPPRSETFDYKYLCALTYGVGGVIIITLGIIKQKDLSVIRLAAAYYFSISWSMLLKTILKVIVGRPRPDTIAKCGGRGTFQDCASKLEGYLLFNQFYSFPSGHSTESMAMGMFITLYLCSQWPHGGSFFTFLKIMPILFSVFVGASRIIDRAHHADDVAMGFLIGGMISYFCEKTFAQEALVEARVKAAAITTDTSASARKHYV